MRAISISTVALFVVALSASALSQAAQFYEFTTAGQTGNTGPSQAQLDTAYSGTNLDGLVTSVGGIQQWTVPNSARYLIEAWGGQGYGAFGGRGAHISGEFALSAGTTLRILVGQKAPPYLNYPSTTYDHQYGGGGGSFVTYLDNTPLLIAGGGGGSHANSYVTSGDGQDAESGAGGANGSTLAAGGTNGLGGLSATSADGGGGLLGNGGGTAAGLAFVNGGLGGSDEGLGGFGGGGGTSSWNNYRGGGGGGYSGGGGANNAGACCPTGGGGGSYNAGSNPVNIPGIQIGDGLVRITVLGIAFEKAFVPDVVGLGQASTLTFTINNSAGDTGADSLDFTDNLPAGMFVASPSNATTTCTGGTLTAAPSSGVISYTGGSVAAFSACTVTVDVLTSTPGVFLNVSGDLTSSSDNYGPASATLIVSPAPGFSKAFSPDTINLGSSSTLALTIDNTASVIPATGLDFADNLPPGMVVAAVPNASSTCTAGVLSAVPGSGIISYSGGSISASASCSISVDVTGAVSGVLVNTTGELTSSSGSSGTATATLIVNAPPAFVKSFNPNVVAVGDSLTLTFEIDNSSNSVAALGMMFVDNLPAGMTLAANPAASNSCGGTLDATPGSGLVGLTGGTIVAGSSCVISVNITATAAGSLVNTTSGLASTLGASAPATATLSVIQPGAPVFGKDFAPNPIAVGGVSTVTFSIDNSANLFAASALDFSDNLPGGLLVATPANASTNCTGGSLSAVDGGNTISYSGGGVAASSLCTVQVDITASAAGIYTSTSDDLTSSAGNSGSASDTLEVLDPGGMADAKAIPTLGIWGLLALTGLLGLLAVRVSARRGIG